MAGLDPKADFHYYLTEARDALLWKLDGLGEYDVRRPLVPTGTNLLGLVKHLASVELGYFGDTFGRPHGEPLPEFDPEEPNADMWAKADETREQIIGQYQRAWAHSDATIAALPLDTIGRVPWWPAESNEVTLHHIVVRVTAETHRHAGQADIVRELIDGAAGLQDGNDNLPTGDQAWWASYRNQVERAAQEASRSLAAALRPGLPHNGCPAGRQPGLITRTTRPCGHNGRDRYPRHGAAMAPAADPSTGKMVHFARMRRSHDDRVQLPPAAWGVTAHDHHLGPLKADKKHISFWACQLRASRP